MKKCPKCKKPFTGDHVIAYCGGRKGTEWWYCALCDRETHIREVVK